VDTHADAHVAAALDPIGGLLGVQEFPTTPTGYARQQDGWVAHAAFMDGLVDDGFIILGGPVGDGEETLHVVQAADEDAIRARLAADPWAQAGLLRIGTIEPWALWLDSRPWKRAP
jgi:uncharacterized protein